jgi:hypothetical protein
MGNKRNQTRLTHVRALRALAQEHGVERVSDNAARTKVTAMASALLAVPDLIEAQKQTIKAAVDAYQATWGQDEVVQEDGAKQDGPAQEETPKRKNGNSRLRR